MNELMTSCKGSSTSLCKMEGLGKRTTSCKGSLLLLCKMESLPVVVIVLGYGGPGCRNTFRINADFERIGLLGKILFSTSDLTRQSKKGHNILCKASTTFLLASSSTSVF